MHQTIKQKWLDALLSTEYEVGRYHLYDGNAWCPLGILCDVYKKETGLGSWIRTPVGFMFCTPEGLVEAFPPLSVLTWADLSSRHALNLQSLNDGLGLDPLSVSSYIHTFL